MDRRGFLGSLSGILAIMLGSKRARAELPPPPAAPEPAPMEPIPHVEPGSVTQRRGMWKNVNGRRVFTDLFEMFDDIAYHTKKTGCRIMSADDPLGVPPMIGFIGEGPEDPYRGSVEVRWWCITLPNVRTSLHAADTGNLQAQHVANIVRTSLRTAAGRTALAASFPGQRSTPWLHPQRSTA
jgi:hypothetical protein